MTNNYKAFWNDKAQNPFSAFVAVDGSADEEILSQTGRAAAQKVIAAIDAKPGDQVFEIGCGVARIGKQVLEHVAHWHGLDISENMLQVAASRLSGLAGHRLSALDRSALPLADESMDAGYCIAVFFHMDKEDFFLYLNDVARVLKPGGRFYFDHWNVDHPVGFRRFLMEARDQASFTGGARRDVARNQFSCRAELERFAAEIGLQMLFVDEAHFIQCVVYKPLPGEDEAQITAHRQALERRRSQIAYSALWVECFSALVDDALQGGQPDRILRVLQQPDDASEAIRLHRIWLRGTWIQNRSLWGEPPEWLMATS